MSTDVIEETLAGIYPAAVLADREYPPLKSYVDGLIVEGLGIIGGKPKLGKSWLVAGLAVAVAAGGVALGNPARGVTQAPVLYAALEDGERRIQSRLRRICPDGIPHGLNIVHDWPRLDAGGIEAIDAAIDADGYGFIIIDTLQRVRGPRRGHDMYGEDYETLSALHDLTQRREGLALTLVHHNRKDDRPDDYVDALSGSTGIGGSPDLVAVLARGRGEADAELSITGRDVTEEARALRFDDGLWTELGSTAAHSVSKARSEILDAVADIYAATREPAHVSQVAEYTGTTKQNVSKLLHALAADGALSNVDRGAFLPEPVDTVDTVDNTTQKSTVSTKSTAFQGELLDA
jgi:RecA-family ATPase